MTKNLTQGSPAKLILFFAIPLLLGNIFQQFYSMADTFIVRHTIGINALAAVGCTGSIMFLILGFAVGFTSGLSIITAQHFGAGDEDGVRRSFAASIVLSLIVTITLTGMSLLFARSILELMRTPENIIDQAYSYIIVILGGIVATMFFNLFSNVLRALGDSRMPLVFLAIACSLNIILDLVLIRVFSMGVAGAAWATITSQMISALLCFVYIKAKQPILKLTKKDWDLSKEILWRHLRVAMPMAFQMSIIAIGAIAVQFALNDLGETSVAAFTIAQRIDAIAILPMMSFGITMATYTAQNYGANNIDRIRLGVKQCCTMSVGFSIAIGFINIFEGRRLIMLFAGKEELLVISQAQNYLVINGVLYFVLALLFIYRYTLQGLGQSLVPTITGIIELLMRAFAALVLAQYLGFTGISLAGPLAWIGACIPLAIAYFMTMKKLEQPPRMRLTQSCVVQQE